MLSKTEIKEMQLRDYSDSTYKASELTLLEFTFIFDRHRLLAHIEEQEKLIEQMIGALKDVATGGYPEGQDFEWVEEGTACLCGLAVHEPDCLVGLALTAYHQWKEEHDALPD